MVVDIFKALDIEPNKPFQVTGQSRDVEFRITDELVVEWRIEDMPWTKSEVELRCFLLGKYSNGTTLVIIKRKEMTIEEIEQELGYKITIVDWEVRKK